MLKRLFGGGKDQAANSWQCNKCTLQNAGDLDQCAACGNRMSKNKGKGSRSRQGSNSRSRRGSAAQDGPTISEQFDLWLAAHETRGSPGAPLKLISVGEDGSVVVGLGRESKIAVITTPTQGQDGNQEDSKDDDSSLASFTIDCNGVEPFFTDINKWATQQGTSVALKDILDQMVATFPDEPESPDAGQGDGEEDPFGEDWGSEDGEGDFKDEGGAWGDFVEDPGMIRQDSSWEKWHGMRKRWADKEALLRAANTGKSIFDDKDYLAASSGSASKQIFTAAEVSQMLQNTLLGFMRDNKVSGISVEPVDNNIFHWRVRYDRFPDDSSMQHSLVALESLYGFGHVELDVKFDMNLFPFYPPDVRPTWPRMENFFMGRIVCMDELLLSKWNPVRRIEDILSAIQRLLLRYGSIDATNPLNNPASDEPLYTESEYQLWRLSMLTEIAPRANVVHSDSIGELALSALGGLDGEEMKRGDSGGMSGSGKDVESYAAQLAAIRKKNQEIQQILGITLGELAMPKTGRVFCTLFSQSCLLPFLAYHLDNKNMVQVEKQMGMYIAVLSILRGMAAHNRICRMFLINRVHHDNGKATLQKMFNDFAGKAARKKDMAPRLASLITVTLNSIKEGITRAAAAPEEEEVLAPPTLIRQSSNFSDVETKNSENETQCPMCMNYFLKTDIECHVNSCLSGSDGATVAGDTDGELKEGESSCMVCGLALPKDALERHVNSCLDRSEEEREAYKVRYKADEAAAAAAAASAVAEAETAGSAAASAAAAQIAALEKQRNSYKGASGGPCPVCSSDYPKATKAAHIAECWVCCICRRAWLRGELPKHVPECISRGKMDQEETVSIHFCRKEEGLLNDMQLRAVSYVQEQARIASEMAYEPMLTKLRAMGKTEDDLRALMRYVRNDAPIIIHVQLDNVLQFFIKDTHYRNQFETNTSKGTLSHATRRGWENRMYNSIYDKSSGFDRCKYGVLNISNAPKGVQACYSYGDSYFLMQNVRLRTTFADMDSGNSNAALATCEYYCHILNSMNDAELRAMLDVATGKKKSMGSESTSTYKEIQIHGEVRLNRDIKAVVVNARHRGQANVLKMLEQFSEKHQVPIVWMS